MNENSLKLRHLLERLTINEITREEFEELFSLINNGAHEQEIKAVLMEGLGNEQLSETMEQERLDTIRRNILSVAVPDQHDKGTPVRRVIPWQRFTTAAAIILLIGTGVWFGLLRKPSKEVVTTEQTNKPVINDVAPGSNKAILTLSDNSTIVLDNAGNGQLAQQGATTIIKSGNGSISYAPSGGGREAVAYNTLSTPRGGQYQLSLPDGSKVWLNSASSITFPTVFTGNERKVAITGEAYFEVAGIKLHSGGKMPFIVEKGKVTIEVLGTHFNVNAYDDEDAIRTTLLEGKVKVVPQNLSAGGEPVLLAPGQQAQVNKAGAITVLKDADVDDVLAWKNGLFHFENADIKTVMRQLSRWYDIDVEYKGAIKSEPLIMEIPRNTNLSDVLKVIESTARLRLIIEGKKVTIL